jgi:hypothetical protein
MCRIQCSIDGTSTRLGTRISLWGAYKAGRAASDPSVTWYKGEIGFFDFSVIPVAKKLDSCGVFGVSSHECLNYECQSE